MWKRFHLFILQKLYRILVVKVYTVDKAVMRSYHKFHTFCDLTFNTNQGRFSFSFKEDNRSVSRGAVIVKHSVASYLVELVGPDSSSNPENPFHHKVIVVVMINTRRVNYESLARVLLDLYIDQFPKQKLP